MPKVKVFRALGSPKIFRHGSKKQIAFIAGVSLSYICDVFSGRKAISLDKLKVVDRAARSVLGPKRAKFLRNVFGISFIKFADCPKAGQFRKG